MTKALTTRVEVKEQKQEQEQLRAKNKEHYRELHEAKIRKKAENIAKNEALMAEQKAAAAAKKAAKRAAHEERLAEMARRKLAKTEKATLNAPHLHWAGQHAGGNFGAHLQPGPSFYPGQMHAEAHHRPEWDTQAAWGQGNKARHPMMGMNKWNTKNTKWEY